MSKKLACALRPKVESLRARRAGEALHVTPRIESFCWRIEQLAGEAALLSSPAHLAIGKSVTLRILVRTHRPSSSTKQTTGFVRLGPRLWRSSRTGSWSALSISDRFRFRCLAGNADRCRHFAGSNYKQSARSTVARMAHLFCELFYRARRSGLSHGTKLDLPINRTQLGEALGMAVATVDRTLLELRISNAMDFRCGKLTVKHWTRLVEIGEFNPHYLRAGRPVVGSSIMGRPEPATG